MKELDMISQFNREEWRRLCSDLSMSATRNSGLSHVVFVKKFSQEIETLLTYIEDSHKNEAIKIAREFDYASAEEISKSDSWNYEHGYCQHGIDKSCCPAGCGG